MAATKNTAENAAAPMHTPAGRFAPGNPGKPKGAANKLTRELRDMVFEALDNAGGAAYLTRQADESPSAFLALLGKFIPRDMKLDVDATVTHRLENIVAQSMARGNESAN